MHLALRVLEEKPKVTSALDSLVLQCRGQGKLLGSDYAEIFFELTPLSRDERHRLQELCILLRTYVVIHDLIFDGNIDRHVFPGVTLADELDFVSERIGETLHSFGKDEQFWHDAKSRYLKGQSEFDAYAPFESVFEKCSLLDVPFEVFDCKGGKERRFVRSYLFMLQMIDDFADFEEDFNSTVKSNIWMIGYPHKTPQEFLIKYRAQLAVSILCVAVKFQEYWCDLRLPDVCIDYSIGLSEWAKEILDEAGCRAEATAPMPIDIHFERFQSFWLSAEKGNPNLKGELTTQVLSKMTAESAHQKCGKREVRTPLSWRFGDR